MVKQSVTGISNMMHGEGADWIVMHDIIKIRCSLHGGGKPKDFKLVHVALVSFRIETKSRKSISWNPTPPAQGKW